MTVLLGNLDILGTATSMSHVKAWPNPPIKLAGHLDQKIGRRNDGK